MIKAALKRRCNLTNTPAYYFTSDKKKKGGGVKFTDGRSCLFKVCLTPSRVIAKAVKVAAEMSSNTYDIKNRTDVFPVRSSVTDSQKPP